MAFLKYHPGFSGAIAGILMAVLLIGGLPLVSGVAIVRSPNNTPAFTLNICRPLPGLNQGSGFSAVPLVEKILAFEKPPLRGIVFETSAPSLNRANERPAIPPPKTLTGSVLRQISL